MQATRASRNADIDTPRHGDGTTDATAASSASAAGQAQPARRKSLAAFILLIPPGDASDDRDFARLQ